MNQATPPPPPDRSHILTEQRNPRTMNLHTRSVAQCVDIIQREDRSISDAMERAAPALTRLVEAAERGFRLGGRLVYLGAGTSGRLGVLDASEAPPTFQVTPDRLVGILAGGDASLRRSSEGMEDDPEGARAALTELNLNSNDTLIGIAAGGTTPYVLGGLRLAKEMGRGRSSGVPITGLLACTPMSTPDGVDHLVVLETGPEVITGSTRMKAGTATKLALNTISTTLMIRSGRVYENLMVDLRATNSKLRDRAARIVGTLTGLGREACFELLDQAGGGVKTAVVMHRLGMSRAKAEEALSSREGRLHLVLGK